VTLTAPFPGGIRVRRFFRDDHIRIRLLTFHFSFIAPYLLPPVLAFLRLGRNICSIFLPLNSPPPPAYMQFVDLPLFPCTFHPAPPPRFRSSPHLTLKIFCYYDTIVSLPNRFFFDPSFVFFDLIPCSHMGATLFLAFMIGFVAHSLYRPFLLLSVRRTTVARQPSLFAS